MGGHYFEGWVGWVVEEVCCAKPFSGFQLAFLVTKLLVRCFFCLGRERNALLGRIEGSISINRDMTYPSPFSIRTSNSACRSIDPDWPSCWLFPDSADILFSSSTDGWIV